MKCGYNEWDALESKVVSQLKMLKQLRAAIEPLQVPPFSFELEGFPSMPRLIVHQLDDLTAARAFLRQAFGTWEDKLSLRWYSGGKTLTSWRSTSGSPLALWLVCNPEDYPEALQGEYCRWEPVVIPETTSLTFTCGLHE